MEKEIDTEDLGNRIKSIRLEKAMNLREFGFYIDKASDSIVSRWEKGKSLPNAKRLKLIANAGGISVDELLYGKEKEVSTITLTGSMIAQAIHGIYYGTDFLDDFKIDDLVDILELHDIEVKVEIDQ